jgi:hypothetical protein
MQGQRSAYATYACTLCCKSEREHLAILHKEYNAENKTGDMHSANKEDIKLHMSENLPRHAETCPCLPKHVKTARMRVLVSIFPEMRTTRWRVRQGMQHMRTHMGRQGKHQCVSRAHIHTMIDIYVQIRLTIHVSWRACIKTRESTHTRVRVSHRPHVSGLL